MFMRLRILSVLPKKKAIHYHVDLVVKVFEENPETSFAEDGGYRMPIKDVQGGRSDQNWMVVFKAEGIRIFDFFCGRQNE